MLILVILLLVNVLVIDYFAIKLIKDFTNKTKELKNFDLNDFFKKL